MDLTDKHEVPSKSEQCTELTFFIEIEISGCRACALSSQKEQEEEEKAGRTRNNVTFYI